MISDDCAALLNSLDSFDNLCTSHNFLERFFVSDLRVNDVGKA